MTRPIRTIEQEFDEVSLQLDQTNASANSMEYIQLTERFDALLSELTEAETGSSYDDTPSSTPLQSTTKLQDFKPITSPDNSKAVRIILNLLILPTILAISYFTIPSFRDFTNSSFAAVEEETRMKERDSDRGTASYEAVEIESMKLEAIAKTLRPNDILTFRSAVDTCTGREKRVFCSDNYIYSDVQINESKLSPLQTLDAVDKVFAESPGWNAIAKFIENDTFEAVSREQLDTNKDYVLSARYEYLDGDEYYCVNVNFYKYTDTDPADEYWSGGLVRCRNP